VRRWIWAVQIPSDRFGDAARIGTILGGGGIRIAPNASISPGLGDVGTVGVQGNVELLGKLLIDLSPSGADLLATSGSVSIVGQLRLIGSFGTSDLPIATYSEC
jgi:hypothetical protein